MSRAEADHVIDLGVVHYDPEAGPAGEPAPGYARSSPDWQRLRRSWVRGWLPAALAVVAVGLLGGAAVPAGPPRLVRVWTVPVQGDHHFAAPAGQTLYALDGLGGFYTLRAYRLADGTLQWTAPVDDRGDWSYLQFAGATPLVISPRTDGTEVVSAVDPGTGRVRWNVQGLLHATLASDLVLLTRPSPATLPVDDGTRPGDGILPYVLVAVDLHTGEVAWSRRFGAGEVMLAPQQHLTHLLTLDDAGRLTRYDPASGAVLASAATRSTGQARERMFGFVPELVVGEVSLSVLPAVVPLTEVEDDLLILPEPAGLAAYDPATLAPRWRLREPDLAWAVPCGPSVCAFVEAGGAGVLTGFDAVTGQPRWRRDCGETDPPPGDDCVLLPAGYSDGTVLVQRVTLAAGEARAGLWAVETAGGELVGELAGWSPAGQVDVGQWVSGREDQADPLAEEPGPLWLARWRSDPAGFEVRGPIDLEWCDEPAGDYLICMPGESGRMEVWRIG